MSHNQPERYLRWDACYNARDLGGYATADGERTRWGAVVRADTMSRLTPAGRAALLAYGVRTIVDLRRSTELETDPNPFATPSSDAGDLTYLHLPLGAGADRDGTLAVRAAGEGDDATLPGLYRQVIDHYWRGIASIMTAIATAQEGAVLFHCHAGKDRTGLIAALLLALAGVPNTTIAEDYALSQIYLKPIYEERLRQELDPAKRARMSRMISAESATMLDILSHLDTRHGGAERYLLAAGVARADVERLRRRIRG
ncbi:MAG TPA: tyrosine-protein phosphatase [Roseiflexaceae bacterium]|nr:tyrosine-protein phosphatase [Roseiflexaceae bacterium]